MKYSMHHVSGSWGTKLDTTRNYLAVQDFFSSLLENYSFSFWKLFRKLVWYSLNPLFLPSNLNDIAYNEELLNKLMFLMQGITALAVWDEMQSLEGKTVKSLMSCKSLQFFTVLLCKISCNFIFNLCLLS